MQCFLDATDYFDEGTLLDGGSSGVYGEIGWFIPQYLAESDPGTIVPSFLKHNETLREMFIDAMINDESNINWIDEFYEIRANLTGYAYDEPDADKPTVFGSVDNYVMSIYAFDQTRNMFDYTGMDWYFASFDGEAALTEMLIDMYSQRLPFVANLYRYLFEYLLFFCSLVFFIIFLLNFSCGFTNFCLGLFDMFL